MTVSSSFRTFVLDHLSRAVPRVHARSMFGGVGIYAGELFFALIDDDTLYLKVDDTNRADFEARGMGPFRPYGEGPVARRLGAHGAAARPDRPGLCVENDGLKRPFG